MGETCSTYGRNKSIFKVEVENHEVRRTGRQGLDWIQLTESCPVAGPCKQRNDTWGPMERSRFSDHPKDYEFPMKDCVP
jgi:hypothetical protein